MAIGTHRRPPLWSSLPQLPPSHCHPPLWSKHPQLPPSLSLHPPPETHQSPSLLLSLCHSICVEMCCLDADYDYYVKLLRLFYLANDLIPDSLESVRTTLSVLQAATALCSNSISQICIEYLEVVPWEDKEEEAILKAVSGLGPSAIWANVSVNVLSVVQGCWLWKCDSSGSIPCTVAKALASGIEGAIISLVLALPSNDQAEILTDWMEAEQVRYPYLSEAFELWCYKTKAVKRRLQVGFNEVGNTTVSF
ncbi:hypothetical protein ACLOJK_008785 [Asimina triloba]